MAKVSRLVEPVDPALFAPCVKPLKDAKNKSRCEREFVLDYLFDDFAIVTERFKSLVDTIDPGVHQFVPCQMVGHDDTPIPNLQRYHFVCGRSVTLNTGGIAPWPASAVNYQPFHILKPDELTLLPSLLANPDTYAALANYPLWIFHGNRGEKYISQRLLDEATARHLTGFELGDKKTVRDVQAVTG